MSSLTKRQRMALEKYEEKNSKRMSTDIVKTMPVDSPEIDLENESIEKKRERQRSIVLNLGKKFFS